MTACLQDRDEMEAKKLCKWKPKEIDEHAVELAAIVRKGRVVCLKCARAAIAKSYLCKPCKLKKLKP